MIKRNHFNPLLCNSDESSAESKIMESLSLSIETSDVCPKCSKDMEVATVSDTEDSFFCPTCRVVMPFTKS